MNMSANNVDFTLSGFKKCLTSPYKHAPNAVVSFVGSSVLVAVLFSRAMAFMQWTMPAVPPV